MLLFFKIGRYVTFTTLWISLLCLTAGFLIGGDLKKMSAIAVFVSVILFVIFSTVQEIKKWRSFNDDHFFGENPYAFKPKMVRVLCVAISLPVSVTTILFKTRSDEDAVTIIFVLIAMTFGVLSAFEKMFSSNKESDHGRDKWVVEEISDGRFGSPDSR